MAASSINAIALNDVFGIEIHIPVTITGTEQGIDIRDDHQSVVIPWVQLDTVETTQSGGQRTTMTLRYNQSARASFTVQRESEEEYRATLASWRQWNWDRRSGRTEDRSSDRRAS